MNTILYVIGPGRQSTEALHWCLHKAQEEGLTLRAVYIVDEEATRHMEMHLAETGFIGDTPGEELRASLDKEYHERGQKNLNEIEKQARSFQIPVEIELKTGRYIDVCEKMVHSKEVNILVIIAKKERFFKKLFEGSEINQLKDRISCEIKVY